MYPINSCWQIRYVADEETTTVPDLAFSELTFLNPHRENSDDLAKPSANKSRHKKVKAADSGANISRYFTSTSKSTNQNELLPDSRPTAGWNNSWGEREHQRCDDRRPNSGGRDPSLPLVELPEKPFLGFGSSGIYNTSPARISCNIGSTTDLPRGKASSTRSTSHVSWSVSGAPSHPSPHLHYSNKISARSPIHIERTRVSTTDIPIANSEIQCLGRGPKQVSVKNGTNLDCPRSILKSHDPVPETEKEIENISIQLIHEPISNSVKELCAPKKTSNDNNGSYKESRLQQSTSNDKLKVASVDEVHAKLPCLPISGSSGGMSQEDSSISFDAELDNFLQKFKPNQTLSVHPLAPPSPAHRAQSEVLTVINNEDSINFEKVMDNLSASENKLINGDVGNSSSRNEATKPSEMPPTRALEVQINDTSRSCEIESLSPTRRRSTGIFRTNYRSDNTKDRLEQTVKSNSHHVFTRNAWTGYNNIYQQQTEVASQDSRGNQACEKVHVPVDSEGTEDRLASHDLVSNIHNELGGHHGYEYNESYNLNGDMAGIGYRGDSHHDESTRSAPHNEEELFYQPTLTSGTELEVPLRHDGLLQHFTSEDFLELEDGYPYLLNHDLDASTLPNNNDRYKHEPAGGRWLESCQQSGVRPWLRAQNGTYDLGGNRWIASVQQNDEELPGFWKPHKRY